MSKVEIFVAWAEANGAVAEIIQPDDGNGYAVIELAIANQPLIQLTVNEENVL